MSIIAKNGAMVVHQNSSAKTTSGDAVDELRTSSLKPAIVSIPDACKYMGGVSRAKFYLDVLPSLETVYLGARHFVVVASIDRLIAKLKNASTAKDGSSKRGRSRKIPTDGERRLDEFTGALSRRTA